MPSIALVDLKGGSRGKKAISDAVFGVKPNQHLLYEAAKHYRAGEHRGTHATKNRAAVRGGGHKPWKQKGTGRARVGSNRTPLWRKGGVVFGPQPRDYSFKLNGKVQKGAIRSALSLRVSENAAIFVDLLSIEKPSTKALKKHLEELEVFPDTVLIIDLNPSEALYLSARNISQVEVRSSGSVTAYDILRARKLIISEQAATNLEERLS